jgi:hypothetical protein
VELRRLSATLRRVLIERAITIVAAPRIGRFLFTVPDNKAHQKDNPGFEFYFLGGAPVPWITKQTTIPKPSDPPLSEGQAKVRLVNPSVPAKTVPEFIAYAKASPGKVNMASPGIGSSNHVASELFKMMTGLDLINVPYRGGAPAMTDLPSGQMQVMFATMASSIEHVKAGKLRALAITTATRSDASPEIAPLADFVPGYEASDWYGLGAPKRTPSEIVDTLSKEINAALIDPVVYRPGRNLIARVTG